MPLDPAQERVVRLLTADVVATLGEPHDDVLQWELANVLELADSLDDFTERLVEDVQQVFHDTFVDTTWPACPRHPNHPLWFRDGAWWCERDGVSIFALGALPARPTKHGRGRLPVPDTERLALRWLTGDDADFILELTNDPDWLRFIGDRGIRTADDARVYIASGPMDSYARRGYGLYAVESKETGKPIGICGLVRREWLDGPDLGFAFLPAFRGMGYAYEAAAATVQHATTLGFDRLLAIVSPDNDSSIRLLTRLGLTFERMAQPAADAGEVCVYGRALA